MSFQYFVIGKGSIGHRHANNLDSLGARVTHYGWRTLNMDQLLSEIMACQGEAGVIIATSTKVRRHLITKCSEVGAALYIEKPIAHRTFDVQQIYDLPETTLERSVAGFMMRYHPMVRKLLDIPVENIFRASFEIGHDVTQWRQNWNFADSYAADPDGGGVLLDLCHEIDLAYLLCGSAPLSSVSSIEHPDFAGVDIATWLLEPSVLDASTDAPDSSTGAGDASRALRTGLPCGSAPSSSRHSFSCSLSSSHMRWSSTTFSGCSVATHA